MTTPTVHIKLTRSVMETDNWQFLKVFRLRVDVTEIKGIVDDRIFIYAQTPVDPYTEQTADVFQCVASAVDMAEYPGGAPDPLLTTPFFRLNYIELDFRAATLADEVWLVLQQEVCTLCQALEAVMNLAVTEEVWCCAPPDATDSISESLSA